MLPSISGEAFLKVLEIVGIVIANLFIYELLIFGFWTLVILPIWCSDKISEETSERVINFCTSAAVVSLIVAIVLYAMGVFRIIPLP